ncbi:hypothetical protein [Haloarchaeobius litoreus]|uniref:DUF5671 domain-containing protein n=1 Tax=Haloarchaeobius litoreus TaxID=755306 RepID=A0ABD6DEB5_9EURY|nr:hypothetical protein [Haloarchaeobius litoreus]
MADSTTGVSVTWYLTGLAVSLLLATVVYGLFVLPLLFGDAALVQDTTAPDGQMRTVSRGVTVPTLVGIGFVTLAAVAHGWLYKHFPRLRERL